MHQTKLPIFLLAVLLPLCCISQALQPLGDPIRGNAANQFLGTVLDISVDGDRMIAGTPYTYIGGTGLVGVYEWNGSAWELLGDYFHSESKSFVGHAVAMSGDGQRIAITFNLEEESDPSFVQVYEWVENTWMPIGEALTTTQATSEFGLDLAFAKDGKTILVGENRRLNGDGQSVGGLYVFDEIEGEWNQRGDILEGTTFGSNLGFAVAISQDGQRIAGSSPLSTEVRVYDWETTTEEWALTDNIGSVGNQDLFGFSIDLTADGNTLVIGAPTRSVAGNLGSGEAIVYEWQQGSWVSLGDPLFLEGSTAESGRIVSISADGQTLAVVALNITGTGTGGGISVFQRTAERYTEWITNTNDTNSFYGYPSVLSGNGQRLAVSIPYSSQLPVNAGSVQVYEVVLSTSLSETRYLDLADVVLSPNPLMDKGLVTYELPEAMSLSIALHNSRGQLVHTLLKKQMVPAGMYKESIDVRDLPSGMYSLCFQSGDRVLTKPVVIR